MIRQQHPFEQVISLLRFPMMVGIVIIHCFIAKAADYPVSTVAYDTMYFLSQIFCRIFVPMFFLISGYLFFYRKDASSWSFYQSQWKKRLRSLLVPYLLWNLFALLFVVVKTYGPLSHLFPNMAAHPLDFGDVLSAFWSFRPDEALQSVYEPSSTPVNAPMWFIRDLLVIVLLSPIIHRLVKGRLGFILPLALLVLFVAGRWFPANAGYSISCMLFFTLGSWMSVHHIDPVAAMESRMRLSSAAVISTVLFLALAFAELFTVGSSFNPRLHALTIVAGVIWLCAFAGIVARSGRVRIPALLVSSSFFLYGFHFPIAGLMSPLIVKVIAPHSSLLWLICYFGMIIGLILLTEIIFAVCRKVLPRFTGLLCGGRV